jgi:hypothetical protein
MTNPIDLDQRLQASSGRVRRLSLFALALYKAALQDEATTTLPPYYSELLDYIYSELDAAADEIRTIDQRTKQRED